MAKRLEIESCAGIVIDVQDHFLKQLDAPERRRIEAYTAYFVNLMTYLRIPILCTVERPLKEKGAMPAGVETGLSRGSAIIEKDFFDLTAEPQAVAQLRSFARKQVVLAGCETDVCVLLSCLGLLNLGYEVFVLEDLIFSSEPKTSAAVARMKAEGAIFLNFKTLYHELLGAVAGSPHRKALEKSCGVFPEKLVKQ
jgi:nicotinamidase-related amidase